MALPIGGAEKSERLGIPEGSVMEDCASRDGVVAVGRRQRRGVGQEKKHRSGGGTITSGCCAHHVTGIWHGGEDGAIRGGVTGVVIVSDLRSRLIPWRRHGAMRLHEAT